METWKPLYVDVSFLIKILSLGLGSLCLLLMVCTCTWVWCARIYATNATSPDTDAESQVLARVHDTLTNATGVCKRNCSFLQALALYHCRVNCSPAPDLVF